MEFICSPVCCCRIWSSPLPSDSYVHFCAFHPGLDWEWDNHFKSSGAVLSCGNRKVSFHLDFSSGTAATRGTKELSDGQHFWEVMMTSPVYGTDMVGVKCVCHKRVSTFSPYICPFFTLLKMVGIGTSKVNLEKFKYNFGSLLGHDEASWGLSYTGRSHSSTVNANIKSSLHSVGKQINGLRKNSSVIVWIGYLQHKGDKVKFSSQFGQGSIIGVHLDTWHGTLTFYKNRHCIGKE